METTLQRLDLSWLSLGLPRLTFLVPYNPYIDRIFFPTVIPMNWKPELTNTNLLLHRQPSDTTPHCGQRQIPTMKIREKISLNR